MPPARLLLALSLLLPAALPAVELVRVWPGYRSAESFASIGEYFGRSERMEDGAVHRSQPAERAGFYWLLRLRNATPLTGIIELAVIRPGQAMAETHRFDFSVAAGSEPLLVGLTGGDWPNPQDHPLAWRIRVLDTDGQVVESARSFLWSAPDESPNSGQ